MRVRLEEKRVRVKRRESKCEKKRKEGKGWWECWEKRKKL